MGMTLLIILLVICLVVFFSAFRQYDALFQFPFLATCDLLFFLAPQLYYIAKHPEIYELYGADSLSLFLVVCILFYGSAIAGYSIKPTRYTIPNWDFDHKKIILGLYCLSAISLYGKVQLNGLAEELTSSTQWTGLPVQYLFFKSVGTLCLPLGIILYFRYRNKLILLPLMSELLSILSVIVLSGKRSPAAFLGLMGLTGLWFARRFKLPMSLILGGGAVFILFVFNIGTYRYLVKSGVDVSWKQVATEVFDVKKTVARFTDSESGHGASHEDAMNGVVTVSAVFTSSRYDFGKLMWNNVVRRWIPGQLVGRKLKKALQLEASSPLTVAREEFRYEAGVGTCVPGYSEIFASFGFLGIIFMFYMGKIARAIWEQAMTGNLIAQIAHFSVVTIFLRFGGGGIWGLLSGLGIWVIFVLPILIFARIPSNSPDFISESYEGEL